MTYVAEGLSLNKKIIKILLLRVNRFKHLISNSLIDNFNQFSNILIIEYES